MATHSRRGVVTTGVVTSLVTLGLLAGGASAQSDDKGKPTDKPAAQEQQQGKPTAAPEQAKNDAAKDKPKSKPTAAPNTDNNGNPGTIKVALPTDGTANDNEPHPGCWARIDFYNFNTKTYGVEFTAIAPTAGGVVGGGTATITVARTGGGDFQQSFTYALDFAGIAPAKQGYHVKVEVTNPDKPGEGAKSKVFWLDCVPAAAPARTSAAGTVDGANAGRARSGLDSTSVLGARFSRLGDDTESAEVLGVRFERPAPSVAATNAKRKGVLAFTGSMTTLLVGAAALLLLTGTALVAASRRRGLSS